MGSRNRAGRSWTSVALVALLAPQVVSCQGIDFDTGGGGGAGVAAEAALTVASSEVTYINGSLRNGPVPLL